jgi:hypothetical protein
VNWSQQEVKLLGQCVGMLVSWKKSSIPRLTEADWDAIAGVLPGRNSEDCYFKLLSFEKHNVREFPWNDAENEVLRRCVENPEKTDWVEVGKAIYKENPEERKVLRSGKQCR